MAGSGSADDPREFVRVSVMLPRDLAEYVRTLAFQLRKSRSAYIRDLIAEAAQANPVEVVVKSERSRT